MTHEEILTLLYEETLVGNAPAVKDGVNQGLELGMDPGTLLYDALIPSLEEVGARFERGDYFVPEMLIAARAMQGALDILRPLLAETGAATADSPSSSSSTAVAKVSRRTLASSAASSAGSVMVREVSGSSGPSVAPVAAKASSTLPFAVQ